MHKMISMKEAKVLLDKYYEGLTSCNEEKILQSFLLQKNLLERFEADKAILSYFATRKKKSKIQIIPFLQWSSIAASVIIAVVVVSFLFVRDKSNSYAYIDGKKVTNIEQVKKQALVSIQSWENSDNNPNLDTDKLIDQQLQLFTK